MREDLPSTSKSMEETESRPLVSIQVNMSNLKVTFFLSQLIINICISVRINFIRVRFMTHYDDYAYKYVLGLIKKGSIEMNGEEVEFMHRSIDDVD